jgi:alkylation response protein AidB-like acyl-CoA dehydrogenase
MDLDFTEEQRMLRETTRGVCAQYAPLAVVRTMEDDPTGYPADLWRQMGALGLIGLMLPERHGGGGQTVLEGAILYEEMGRGLTPSPHFVSAVLAGGVLTLAGSEEQKKAWLPRIAGGETIVTPAWLEPDGGYGPRGVRLRAVADGDGYRLDGSKRHVHFARAASRFLVLARTGEAETDVDLFLVDPGLPGIELTQQLSLASDTQYRVDLRGVRVPASARIGAPRSGWAAWDQVMHDGIIVLAAQAIGGAARALEMTVAYAKERRQFDKPLGAFQAIAHYLADAATAVDGGTTLVYEAAWARARGRSVGRLAPMAKLFACQTYRDVTAMSQQVHGGLGFTVEYDIQLYFRRAKQLQMSWWDTAYLEELIARDVLDGATGG